MSEPVTSYNVSLNSFQSFDGTNLTIGGLEQKLGYKKGYLSTFIGVGTGFKDNTNLVLDLKVGMDYNKSVNQNLRIRNNINGDNTTTQVRYSPLSVNFPIGENTSFYANPHYSGKYNYKSGEWKHSAGIFAGVTQKFGKTSVSLEAQRYNLQDIRDNSGENWSLNAILSYKF